MRDIVAIRFGPGKGIITNDPKKIISFLKDGRPFELLDRQRMKFMAACDLGQIWESLANGITLVLVDDEGNIYPAIEKEELK